MRLEIPVTEELEDELYEFWDEIFGRNPDLPRGALLGDESEHNGNVLYLDRRTDGVAGTCLTTTCVAVPHLGIFGFVATSTTARRSGIATALCSDAVRDFGAAGGGALFLGTGNPEAARVYHRLGWRQMAGSTVWANVFDGGSPEEFLVDYFRPPGEISVRVASPAERVPMVPLIHAPHDWRMLDANAGDTICSTRYAEQGSCGGLYPRYESVRSDGRGQWFAAHTSDGRVVGLATARLDDNGGCRVDGFAHKRHTDAWEPLIKTAMDWAGEADATRRYAAVCVEDEEKRAEFESLGFADARPAEPFRIGDREVAAVEMER